MILRAALNEARLAALNAEYLAACKEATPASLQRARELAEELNELDPGDEGYEVAA